MKTIENQEIGELLAEITGKGFGIQILPNGCRLTRGNDEELLRTGGTLSERLAFLVDYIRTMRGEPTLAEEVAKMSEADEAHSHQVIQCGPYAACACGSRSPLIVERKLTLRASWMGTASFSREFNPYTAHELTGLKVPLLPGETGRCPDCGKFYALHAG